MEVLIKQNLTMESNITKKPVKIEITYSNAETSKLGVKAGDQFEALQEVYKGIPKTLVLGPILKTLNFQSWKLTQVSWLLSVLKDAFRNASVFLAAYS